MAGQGNKVFKFRVKGKIIVGALLACLTLLLAWATIKSAFNQTLQAVANISAPNSKLRLVNDLTHRVARLDQLQKARMLNNPAAYYGFFKETKKLTLIIDTLQNLFEGDDKQIARVKSLKTLLRDRDRLFIDYLKVREGLVKNKTFSNQVKQLNDLVNKSARQTDSTVTTTQKKTSTTITPTELDDSTQDNRSFISRLFGKKQQVVKKPAYKVVDEELHIDLDTVTTAKQLSILKGMGETMRRLEQNQQRSSALFINKESVLNAANDKLIRRILSILTQVEQEAVTQAALNNQVANLIVHTSVGKVRYIVIAFIILTLILLYFILADISRSERYRKEIELARDEAEYYGQAKHRFLSNMSHEIRTPLQSIIGYTELIKNQEHPNRKDIDAIYQSSEHLMHIVNEVLDYNRIISGKFTFTSTVFSMNDLLNEVISVMKFQADSKDIRLITDYQFSENDNIEGDAFRLKQVLYNIIGNAIKFTDKGEVKVSVKGTASAKAVNYTFAISDTGIGLSEKDISKIFNEFEQADDQHAMQAKGTGLGLTISKALIEGQGGQINVSGEPGKGSTFTFNVSHKTATQAVNENKQAASKARQTIYDKVWIVDDDNFILDLCSAIFTNHGVPHKVFNSPADVLATTFDPEVKTILLDIRMPGMSGAELCRELRKIIPTDVSIYALTAQVLPNELENVLNQGFDGLLLKPFKEQDLLALVSRFAPTQPIVSAEKLNTGKIAQMTFGDTHQLHKIMNSFIDDCRADIAELSAGLQAKNRDQLILIIHRLAGRTAQIGAVDLATDLRKAEMDLSNNMEILEEEKTRINGLIKRLTGLIAQINSQYAA